MFESDLSNPLAFLVMTIFMFGVIAFRYFLIAGLFYSFFYLFKPEKWTNRKVNQSSHNQKQFRKEIKWSVLTALIFAITGSFTVLAWQKDYTAFYKDVNKMGWAYLVISIFLMMLLHETYYYWIHRLMHHGKLYKHVHKIHHESVTTSPWTAFSFHPIEGLIEALILPLIIFILPIHYYALFIYLMIMTISSVVNHLNIEIFPSGFEKHFLGKWFIGATHHSLHHTQFRYNYGLYFTFWDKWINTESPDFKALFKNKTSPFSLNKAKSLKPS